MRVDLNIPRDLDIVSYLKLEVLVFLISYFVKGQQSWFFSEFRNIFCGNFFNKKWQFPTSIYLANSPIVCRQWCLTKDFQTVLEFFIIFEGFSLSITFCVKCKNFFGFNSKGVLSHNFSMGGEEYGLGTFRTLSGRNVLLLVWLS